MNTIGASSNPSQLPFSREPIIMSSMAGCGKFRRMPVLSDDSITANPRRSSSSFNLHRRVSSPSAIKIVGLFCSSTGPWLPDLAKRSFRNHSFSSCGNNAPPCFASKQKPLQADTGTRGDTLLLWLRKYCLIERRNRCQVRLRPSSMLPSSSSIEVATGVFSSPSGADRHIFGTPISRRFDQGASNYSRPRDIGIYRRSG